MAIHAGRFGGDLYVAHRTDCRDFRALNEHRLMIEHLLVLHGDNVHINKRRHRICLRRCRQAPNECCNGNEYSDPSHRCPVLSLGRFIEEQPRGVPNDRPMDGMVTRFLRQVPMDLGALGSV